MLQRSNVYNCKNHAKGICAIEVRKIYFGERAIQKEATAASEFTAEGRTAPSRKWQKVWVGDKKTGWKVLLGQQGRGEHFSYHDWVRWCQASCRTGRDCPTRKDHLFLHPIVTSLRQAEPFNDEKDFGHCNGKPWRWFILGVEEGDDKLKYVFWKGH